MVGLPGLRVPLAGVGAAGEAGAARFDEFVIVGLPAATFDLTVEIFVLGPITRVLSNVVAAVSIASEIAVRQSTTAINRRTWTKPLTEELCSFIDLVPWILFGLPRPVRACRHVDPRKVRFFILNSVKTRSEEHTSELQSH